MPLCAIMMYRSQSSIAHLPLGAVENDGHRKVRRQDCDHCVPVYSFCRSTPQSLKFEVSPRACQCPSLPPCPILAFPKSHPSLSLATPESQCLHPKSRPPPLFLLPNSGIMIPNVSPADESRAVPNVSSNETQGLVLPNCRASPEPP